jgi:hypothetical protein
MKVTIGEKGLFKTWQQIFPKTTKCCYCKGEARIGFVVHEAIDHDDRLTKHTQFVCDLHENKGKGNFWVHDCIAVAVYFCRECLETTSLYNQA